MPFVRMRCNEAIPERERHIYRTEKDRSIIPACNMATLPGDMTERG